METSYVGTIVATLAQEPKLAWLLIAVIFLSTWRLYRFTIYPVTHPCEPKEYPYWVPFIGHLTSFYKNSCKLLSESRLYFNDRREPYALTVAGQKWYILTNPDDVAATYKINNGSLSYEIFTAEVIRMIGISKDGSKKAFQTEDPEKPGATRKSLVALAKEFHIRQLYPGKMLDQLVNPAVDFLDRNMNVSAIAQRGEYADATGDGAVTVCLFRWISDFFITFGQRAYFGEKLSEIEPNMFNIFMQFDAVAWQVLYQYPTFLCSQMVEARSKMQAAMEEYLAVPAEARSDAAWLIRSLEDEMRRLKICTRDQATFFFQIFWSISANTRKTPFWMLAYMLYEPGLIETVRNETKAALSGETIDIEYLVNNCLKLNSVWDETMRITAFAASVRFLTEDVELGGKILRKGNRIMMPQRQLHFSESIFGDKVTQFDSDRFIRNPTLKKNPSLRPFGGGATLCPGRFIAKHTTLVFIALALQRFDMKLDPPSQPFPIPEEGNPTLGLVDLKKGYDLKVKLCPRTD